MSESIPNSSEPVRARHSRRHTDRDDRVWWGMALILLGALFIVQRMGIVEIHNWWALFILIPAFSSFAAAVSLYHRQGHFSYGVRNSMVGGLFPLAVALLFLFDLDWAVFWPVFILLGGVSMLSNGVGGGSGDPAGGGNVLIRASRPWTILTGLGVFLLGTGFLTRNLNVFDPETVLNHWWGAAILFPALGGLISAGLLYREREKLDWVVLSNLVLAVCVAVPGIVALLGLSWNLVGPIILITAGLVMIIGFQNIERQRL